MTSNSHLVANSRDTRTAEIQASCQQVHKLSAQIAIIKEGHFFKKAET